MTKREPPLGCFRILHTARSLFLFAAHHTQTASDPLLLSKLLTSLALTKIGGEAMEGSISWFTGSTQNLQIVI